MGRGGNKFYAVRNGREVGVYSSWSDCQRQVVGVPGNVHKSFKASECVEVVAGTPGRGAGARGTW